jgi:hypothetical protein
MNKTRLDFPVADSNTPLTLARGLIEHGVSAQGLAEVAVNPCALRELAAVIRRYTPVPCEIPTVAVEVPEVRESIIPDISGVAPTLRIAGVPRYPGMRVAQSLPQSVVLGVQARHLLEHSSVEGTDESRLHTFMFISNAPFANSSWGCSAIHGESSVLRRGLAHDGLSFSIGRYRI